MSAINQIASDLYKAVSESDERKVKPYDVKATVLREEGNIVWVKIPGGVDETPVQKTNNANPGDDVMVRIAGGRAWLLGNETSPATDNTVANAATQLAEGAGNLAKTAADSATEAQQSAQIAYNYADQAHDAAERAFDEAEDAHDEAVRATQYANNALAGLSTVESVVDVVNWFSDHKTASTDTTVVADKTYYIYNPTTGTLSEVVPTGSENPSQEGWYELNEAISNYVASHIAQTADGLYVVGLSNGWKVLVSSGAGDYTPGIFLIDPTGNIAQATTANSITFDQDKSFTIGDSNASIIFDGDGHITITGSGVTFGSQSMSNVLDELDSSIKSIEYGKGSSATSHSDITSWSTNTPTWEEGKYIWMRTTTNGLTYTYTCIQGAKGEDGQPGSSGTSVTVSSITYAVSTTETQPADSAFTNTSVPTVAEGSWLWTKTEYSDGSKIYTKSKQGKSGTNGTSVTVTKIEYGTSSSASTTPSSWSTTAPTSFTKGTWLWIKTTYSDNSTATAKNYIGTDGTNGTNGTTFIPSVDANGNISWTNDGGKTNPTTQNIKGPRGADGKMLYATSSTDSNVSAKVATLTSGTLSLTAGALVAVTFTHANDSVAVTSPTLNIGGTGAKAIKSSDGTDLSETELNWVDGACILFVYDGTYWRFADSGAYYGLSVLNDEYDITIEGDVCYQYTVDGTTYDVRYEDGKYYYYNAAGVKTEVAYENLDRVDGEVISFRKGGLSDRTSNANSSISKLQETVGGQSEDLARLHTQADGNSRNIESQASDIARLQNSQSDINTAITATNTSIVNLDNRISVLERGVVIDPEEPSVTVVSQSGAVKVTDGRVTIKGAGNTVSWADDESFNAKRLVSSDIRPRYMKFDGDKVTLAGSYTIIGRSNGHLSVVKTLA